MKISVMFVSNKLESFENEWLNLYQERLSKYVSFQMIRLDAKKKFTDEDFVREVEKKAPSAQIVLLDDEGKSWNTQEWKTWIDKQENQSTQHLCFVLGESYGFSDALKKKYPFHMSLSKLTFPHKLALLILVEQLYRVYSWKAGSPYHHA